MLLKKNVGKANGLLTNRALSHAVINTSIVSSGIQICLFLCPRLAYGALETVNNKINNAINLYNVDTNVEREKYKLLEKEIKCILH